ncbi:MAG: hypothetical protein ACE5MK_04945 [Acidobacteriota bacterium]
MALDLDNLEIGLKKELARLDLKRSGVAEKLQALVLVREAFGELSGVDGKRKEQGSDSDSSQEELGLSLGEAILEVIKTFSKPLKASKITEELVAVGYPFETDDPTDSVDAALEEMQNDGEVKRKKTIKGIFFALPD